MRWPALLVSAENVVRAGVTSRPIGWSSPPMTPTSFPTTIPISATALITPSATVSWPQMIAVGGSLASSSFRAAWVRTLLSLAIELLKPIPAVALIPAAVLAFGFSWKTEITVTVFASIWPLISSSRSGIERLHARTFEVAATLHLDKWHAWRSVVLPAAFRQILVGAKLSFSLCVVVSVVAEMVGNPAGLGWGLVRAQEAMRASETLAYLFAIGILGVCANFAVDLAVKHLIPGLAQRR
jgi:ABC-type nitrate/sulfonate/bicarbonate transport system permease component